MTMTPDDFRRIALDLPGVAPGEHHGKQDFRVRSKIFATLRPEDGRGVVRLPVDEQELLVNAAPVAFAPVPGAWGRQGWTTVALDAVDEPSLADALRRAWRALADAPGRRPPRR